MLDEEPPWRIRALRGLLRRVPRGRYRLLAAAAPTRGRFTARLAGDIGGARFACDMGDQISREACLTDAYRRALDPRVDIESLLLPLDRWRGTPWPHLLWLC